MFKHYLLNSFKHLWRRKLYSSISIVSLMIGLSIFSLIFLHVKREFSYNKGWPESETIHRLLDSQLRFTSGINSGVTDQFTPIDTSGLNEFLESSLDSYTQIYSTGINIEIDGEIETRSFRVTLAEVNSNFSDIFQVEVLEGNLDRVLNEPGFIALDENLAIELFGSYESALGQSLTASSSSAAFRRLTTSPVNFQVEAVYRQPTPRSSSVSFLAFSLHHDYTKSFYPERYPALHDRGEIWMKLKQSVSVESVNNRLKIYVDQYVESSQFLLSPGQSLSEVKEYRLQPLNDVYFDSPLPEFPSGQKSRLFSFMIVGVLVLLAGCSNAISLGLASALESSREIGIRKSSGALPGNIFYQYLGVTLTLALLSLLPTIALIEWLHPTFASLLSIRDMPMLAAGDIAILVAITTGVGLVIGFYPALVLAKLKPVNVLKGQTDHQGGPLSLRTFLVGVQFSFAIVLLVVTLALYLQLLIIRNQPMGFDSQNLVVVRSEVGVIGGPDITVLLERLKNVSGVKEIVGSTGPTTTILLSEELVHTQQDESGPAIFPGLVGPGHFDFLRIPLLAGREFVEERDVITRVVGQDVQRQTQRILINKTAAKALGFLELENAVNAIVFMRTQLSSGFNHYPMEIIGVVDDTVYSNLKERPVAQMFSLRSSTNGSTLLVRYDSSAELTIKESLSQAWEEAVGSPPRLTFFDEVIDSAYQVEQKESLLLLLCALMTLLLSCIGLYGLVSISLQNQMKEVGVRKVLGATVPSVMSLFLWRFTKPILLANLIAWPIAVYFILQWIKAFPYQIEKIWLFPLCLFASSLVLFIAWVTVSALTYKAASQKPVLALRYE